MTDTQLLDALQKLFDTHTVAVCSRRSGLAIDVAESDFSLCDKEHEDRFRRYWGGTPPDEHGNDLRAAIERAIAGERTP